MPNQVLIKDGGGTIETFFVTARPSSVTVSLYDAGGGLKVDAASATVDTVSTSVSSAVAAGATTVALASATGVVSGGRYVLGDTSSTAPQEVVTVRSLSSSTATLAVPAVYAHASGDIFRGGRAYYSVATTATDAVWWGGYAVWTPASGDASTEAVDCARRKIPDALIDSTDIFNIFPKGAKMLDGEFDLPRGLREARDKFLRDLGGKFQVHTLLGADDLKYGCSLCFWLMRGPSLGPDWADAVKNWEAMYDAELQKLASQMPVDADSDGATNGPQDGGYTTGRIDRA